MSLSAAELKKYWDSATILRKNLDAAEYKHIVLGLVFLKYVSDSFAERRDELASAFSDPQSERYKPDAVRLQAALDDRNYYREVNVFWVPEQSRWEIIQENSKQADIATQIDNALYEVEKENPKLEGIVERRYADAKLPAADLGAVVDLVGSINFGNDRRQASDVLGQVYEYFLGMFASAEGKLGGQFYTTPSIVKTLVEVLQPTSGRVYDPCCGSGGMFVQSERFLEAHGGKLGDIAIYGQESNPTTRRLCAMNLAIRGIDFDLGKTHGDTFLENQHPDKRFDFILMNPPFGSSASYPKAQLENDVRWKKYGLPRERPANYAWMSHAIHQLSPKGRAGIVMPKNTLNSEQGTDLNIRRAILDDDLVECIVEMPGNLFFNTSIPSVLWFINKRKSKSVENKVLFIDASSLGHAISKSQIEFSDEDVSRIADTYNRWAKGEYVDESGWAASISREAISVKGNSLATSRYIVPATKPESVSSDVMVSSTVTDLAVQLRLASVAISKIQERVDLISRHVKPSTELSDTKPSLSDMPTRVPNSIRSSLQNLTGGLFSAMFVDFSICDEQGSMSSLAANLEISKFYNSNTHQTEFGPIPAGWRIATLGEIADVVDCLHSKKPELLESGRPYIQLRCIKDDGSFDLSQLDFISDEDYEYWTSRIEVQGGDCIITNVGRVGAVSQIPPGFKGAIGRNITAIRPKSPDYTESFLAELMVSDFMKREIRANTDSGTVLDALNVRSIANLKLILPPDELLQIFESVVRPLRYLAQTQQDWISGSLFSELLDGI